MAFEHIAVLGGGAWGTALANVAAWAGRKVTLWEFDAGHAAHLAAERESKFLRGVKLDASIKVTNDLAEAAKAQAILLVVPAQAMRSVVTTLAGLIASRTPLIVCAKGIERGTRKFMTEIVAECAPNATAAILSGPSFAADAARGLPTAVTLAAPDESTAAELAQALASRTFRPYQSTDIRGAEIGGATKNVLAIASGIVTGRGLGASAQAALITRGLAELVRFGRAFGGRTETMMGLSGLGDLVLTCSSTQSRNFSFGVALGKGEAVKDIHAKTGLAEGAFTAPVLLEMAKSHNVDMPISSAIGAVLAEQMSVDEAIASLLARPVRAED
jgi:glycerol-3-phosphate dehydrogenase (NAD(P)+)